MNWEKSIFLAHASEDKDQVRILYSILKEQGFEPWLDEVNLQPGDNWDSKIREAISKSRFFIACISRNSLSKSGFIQRELRLALDELEEKLPQDNFFIPALFDNVELPDIRVGTINLSDYQSVKVYEDKSLKKLLEYLKTTLGLNVDVESTEVIELLPSINQNKSGKEVIISDKQVSSQNGTLVINNHYYQNKNLQKSSLFWLISLAAFIPYLMASEVKDPKIILLLVPLSIPILYYIFNRPRKVTINKFKLDPSFDSGIYGGLIGGTIAGLLLALIYYFQPLTGKYSEDLPLLTRSLLIIPYGSVVGIILGASSQIGMMIFRKLNGIPISISILFGGITGSIIGGGFIGAWGAWFFAQLGGELAQFGSILISSIFCSISILLGILSYTYQGKIKYVLRALMTAIIISIFVAMIPFFVFNEAIDIAKENLSATQPILHLEAGGILGSVVGGLAGFIISLTMVLYSFWKFAEKQKG